MRQAIRIHPLDTVAVALQPLAAGQTVDLDGIALRLTSDIPAGHKFALRDIAEGEDIIKYGNPIGRALRSIAKGGLVDHHNIHTNLSGTLDYSGIKPQAQAPSLPAHEGEPYFQGYLRPDGQVGIRNDIWVIPTVGCVNGICRQIVEKTLSLLPREGESLASLDSTRTLNSQLSARACSLDTSRTLNSQLSALNSQLFARACSLDTSRTLNSQLLTISYFPHTYGCSQLGDDHENTRKILRDMVLHPNAGGVLVVGLGCENNQPHDFEAFLGDYDRSRIRFLVCQEVDGDEVEAGVAIVKELYEQALSDERVPVPLSTLRVGLKCGGSDGFSGITANPLLGAFSDYLCMQAGGTTILTEVPEMFGAEHLLMRRAASDDVLQSTIHLINDFKEYFISHGQPVGENPSPGNKAGGISTLEEKALGCTQKSGTSPVRGVLAYGERLTVDAAGLHLLSAPGNDLVASTALAAAGCQLVLFTTGRGTPFSTFVPTVKVSTNSDLARRKPEWIDFDAGVLLEGVSMDQLLQRFVAFVIDVASGRPTTADRHGNAEFAIFKTGVTL